jgi:hypothetical protein
MTEPFRCGAEKQVSRQPVRRFRAKPSFGVACQQPMVQNLGTGVPINGDSFGSSWLSDRTARDAEAIVEQCPRRHGKRIGARSAQQFLSEPLGCVSNDIHASVASTARPPTCLSVVGPVIIHSGVHAVAVNRKLRG